jgi:formimidoylglutamase
VVSTVDPHWPRASEWLARGCEDPQLTVFGVPTAVASISGSDGHLTPHRFRQILSRFSTFHGETSIDLEALRVRDLGDWDVATLDMESSQAEIAVLAAQVEPGSVAAFIGGDNAITRPLVGGLSKGDLSRVAVLTLDAHHDVRVLDHGPTNGTPIRGLFEDGLPDGRVAQVGIHGFANSAGYRRYCKDHAIEIYTMADIDAAGPVTVVSTALDLLAERADRIYVDFDMDVLDSTFAPGCPGSRPGGMSPRQLAAAAFMCGAHPNVFAADFVEVDPARDRDDVTLMNLANTVLSFAAGLTIREIP